MIGVGRDCLSPVYVPIQGNKGLFLRCACGHCTNCRMVKSDEWCLRNQMESYYYSEIAYLTFTYEDDKLSPHIGELPQNYRDGDLFDASYKDFQLFMKNLRETFYRNCQKLFNKRSGYFHSISDIRKEYPLKYFVAYERGENLHRPHFHALIYGLPVLDNFYCTDKNKAKLHDYVLKQPDREIGLTQCLYNIGTDAVLQSWDKGFVKFKPFFKQTCAYVSGYVLKKQFGFHGDEYMRCSHGLGLRWFEEFKGTLTPEHFYINVGEYKKPVPRYFVKKLEKEGLHQKITPLALQGIQESQYKQLCKHVQANNGVTMKDYWNQRIYDAQKNYLKRKHSRLENKEF